MRCHHSKSEQKAQRTQNQSGQVLIEIGLVMVFISIIFFTLTQTEFKKWRKQINEVEISR